MRAIFLFGLAGLLMILAVYVWRARVSSINRWFGLFTIAISGWALAIAGVETGFSTEFWGRVTFASAAMIPAAFLAFTDVFPTPTQSAQRSLRCIKLLGLSLATAFALMSLFTPLIAHDIYRTDEGIERTPGPLYPAFTVYFLLCSLAAISTFVSKWRRARGLARAQLQYLGIGMLTLSIGGITTNLLMPALTGRSFYSWLGPYFAFPFVALIAHSIIRYRLMDLRLVIHRGFVYLLAVAFLSALGVIAGRLLISDWQVNRFSVPANVAVIVVVIFVLISRPAERLFTQLIDPYLFRSRLDYPIALREATHRLSHLMEPAEFSSALRAILCEAFVPETIVMVVRPDRHAAFEVLHSDWHDPIDTHHLGTVLMDQPSPCVIVSATQDSHEKTISGQGFLRSSGAEVTMVLGRRHQVLGAVLLGPRRSGDAYFATDLAFIESLAELASIALENALLYRQRIQMLEYSERLLESLHSAVVAVNTVGHIVSFNRAAKDLLDLDDSHKGQLLDTLPSEISWALTIAIVGDWRPQEIEVTIETASRGSLPVILSAAVMHAETPEGAGAFVVVTDLSTVKALERNQRRIEHFATMARFYAGIAHEIRSPLTSISNFVAMLADRFDDPEYRDTAARLLPNEVARIVRLADRLRLMAPSEDGALARVAITPLLSDIVAIHTPASHEHGVNLLLECRGTMPTIVGDPGQLVQLFVNLLNNAVESMPTGGTVIITAEQRLDGRAVTVRLADEGVGIDPMLRNKVFQPFFTTKGSGTGLGLSICQEIAHFHRARLTLSPRPGARGTVAQVDFPVAPQEDNPGISLPAPALHVEASIVSHDQDS